MPIKKIKPKGASFRYNPGGKQLRLSMSVQFIFNFTKQKFEFNQNPLGERDTRPINNIVISDDLSKISFDTEEKKQFVSYNISAEREHEHMLLGFLSRVNKEGFSIAGNDREDIQLVFQGDVLSEITTYKRSENYELLDSLDIVVEDGNIVLIQQDPWRRINLESVVLKDGDLISRSGDEEFIYHLDTQPFIFDTVKGLIESGLKR
ncbi:MAG TPA: hypothetical protein VGD35_04270 [Chitinophaga sp.]